MHALMPQTVPALTAAAYAFLLFLYVAIAAFERAHSDHELELGVLYLAAGRLQDARDALDRVPRTSPAYPMAAFKRAQVAVLLHETDAPSRIATARQVADSTTRELIARERLFQ